LRQERIDRLDHLAAARATTAGRLARDPREERLERWDAALPPGLPERADVVGDVLRQRPRGVVEPRDGVLLLDLLPVLEVFDLVLHDRQLVDEIEERIDGGGRRSGRGRDGRAVLLLESLQVRVNLLEAGSLVPLLDPGQADEALPDDGVERTIDQDRQA